MRTYSDGVGARRDRRSTHGEGPEATTDLHLRALQSIDVSFTIADPHQPDTPLIWVNDAFTRTTGYPFAEAVGRNCRFLQGPRSDRATAAQLGDAVRERRPARVELLNYRKDGSTFWNEIVLAPVFDRAGRLTHFVGVQDDVTARVEARAEREELLDRERRTRSAAERATRVEEAARGRLELLWAATNGMVRALRQAPEALRALTDVLVPGLADLAAVDLAGTESAGVDFAGDLAGGEGSRRIALTGLDAGLVAAFTAAEAAGEPAGPARGLVGQILATGEPILISQVGEADLAAATTCPVQLDAYRRLRPRSIIAVPLSVGGRPVGALRLISTTASTRHYDRDDLNLTVELGRRASLLLENAHLYGRAHAVAETLQRSLLPDMPTVPGLTFAARYLPASDTARVGGDWYDVLLLPGGRFGLAIGDVMGHDLPAATAMAQFRSTLRAYAWELVGPGEVLDRLDRLVQGLAMDSFATAFFAILEPDWAGGGATLTYANAGHLPPLLSLGGTGEPTVRPLTGAQSIMLGVATARGREEVSVPFPAGSTLLLYTDGLVEQRGRDIDDGIDLAAARLARYAPSTAAARTGLVRADLEELADGLIREVAGDEPQQDDIAVLLVQLTRDLRPT
ncbi:SpoIIE family protein phosphatase [Frankia sp. AgB1.9]|nr:SpoIIE family protein phosphatase [Frankia sp. AgW1.1]MBL7547682.1 SpoIIE family protein phosphatase [Frankia sp. AgB1.9]MBL7624073.1 SpoIIE family protein phosphatase [Frankia sp. AgB1.8]